MSRSPATGLRVARPVAEVEAGAARGLPIVVLASGVTDLDLQGLRLLLELRRCAAAAGLRMDHPSSAVRDAVHLQGLAPLLEPG